MKINSHMKLSDVLQKSSKKLSLNYCLYLWMGTLLQASIFRKDLIKLVVIFLCYD